MPTRRPLCDLCTEAGRLLGGKADCAGESCSITIPRKITATVQGRRVRADEVLGISVVFEELDGQGMALCLLEATLLEAEVNPFAAELLRHQVTVSAVHNHWLADQPRLIYLHAQAVRNPAEFARALQEALRTLKS
jgi:hypothetical protein